MKICHTCGHMQEDGAPVCILCGQPFGKPPAFAPEVTHPDHDAPAPFGKGPSDFPAPPPSPTNENHFFIDWILGLIPLAIYGVLCMLLVTLAGPIAFRAPNLRNVSLQLAPVLPLYLAAALTVRSRGLDLSLAAIFTLAAFLTATVGLVPALLVAVICGLLNGGLVVGLRLPSIPVSLVMASIYTGICFLGSMGSPITMERAAPVSDAVFVFVAFLCIIGAFAYNFLTPLGRAQRGKSAQKDSILSHLLAYGLAGLLAGIGGILMLLRIRVFMPTMGGANYYITLILIWAALKSTRLADNQFAPVLYAALLAGINAVFNNAMILVNLSAYSQQIVVGSITLLFLLALGIQHICTDLSRKAVIPDRPAP